MVADVIAEGATLRAGESVPARVFEYFCIMAGGDCGVERLHVCRKYPRKEMVG
jgi:hypothetical protein